MSSPKPKLNPDEIMATLREVTVTYDGYQTRALSRVDLDIRRGFVTGVLGMKGAGKSTTLKVLAGRLRPTEGKVKVFRRSPRGIWKSQVGYLPGKADYNRPPGLVDRLLGRKKEASSVARGVARLAQAMLGNRDILVLDDPFADLDAKELIEAKALIRDMVSRGKTVVLSSDSLKDVKDLCQRLVILHDGKVQASGTLDELLSSETAIRFLPAVLPADTVARVLELLRQEIYRLPETTSLAVPEISPKSPAQTDDQRSKKMDPVDHDKLESLTKPGKSQ
jgi:ABC-type multidrug transport system ATPase subunit